MTLNVIDTSQAAATSRLARAIAELPTLSKARPARARYEHMGALLADSGLQAGLRYDTVVAPRVARLVAAWPQAVTTSSFLDHILSDCLATTLAWSHPEKLRRIESMARLLHCESVETVSDLRRWIADVRSRELLRGLRGIGEKTVSYIAMLSGLSIVAVDRHVRRFVAEAGFRLSTYDEHVALVVSAADNLGLDPATVDEAIWLHFARG